jgi:S-DNA-T family DNA segregation ATPase FtsK/SpoIIIE
MGTFGVFSYAIFSSLFLIAKTLVSGKELRFEKKYVIYFAIAIISFLAILQMAFLGSGVATSFFAYLGDVYTLQTSVGGVVIALITYPLLKLLNPIGAYIFYIILLTIMSALLVDYFQQNNVFKKSSRSYVNFNKRNEVTIPTKVKNKQKKALFEQPETAVLFDSAKTNNQMEQNPTYNFENKKQTRLQTQETPENKQTTFEKKPFEPIWKTEKETRRPPKILHTDYTESNVRNARIVSKEDDETRRKNLEFLRSIIPNKNGEEGILGTNVANPNEQFTTSFLNKKINERLSNAQIDRGIDDVEAKFEADLKLATSKGVNNQEEIIIKEPTSISQVKENKPNKKEKEFEQLTMNQTKEVKPVEARYKKPSRYVRPPFELLSTISTSIEDYGEEYLEKSQQLERVLNDFKVPAKVIAVTRGPAVTRYELQMPAGVSVKKIIQHSDDIAMTLASNGDVRIEAPIPGRNAVGVEVPNNKIATISLKDVIESKEFLKSRSPLTFGLGKDIAGNVKVCDLARMPHLLVAGATGSGKSVCLNSLIVSLLYKSSPEDLRLILIDPKRVEFYVYNNLPHLMLPEVITEPDKAINALNWAIEEMEKRFQIFQDTNVKNLNEYNMQPEIQNGQKAKMPIIVIIVDELADLMLTSKREVEDKIMRLAAKARAAGIHLVLATQRPSVDVITGTIKANLPSRVAFSVSSIPDSKTILDGGGAEKLLGKGDMLYAPIDYPEPRRIQGAFISNDEVRSIVEFIKQNNKAYFDEEASQFINKKMSNPNAVTVGDVEVEMDPLLPQALKLFIESGQGSTSMLQRKFAIGFSRAGRIVDQMEELKYISPSDGAKARNVYITMEKYKQIFEED